MRLAKPFAIVLFGVLFPAFVLYQAYLGIASLKGDVAYNTTLQELPAYVNGAVDHAWSANDYALFSLLYVEHANQKTMTNKQVMKTAIVQIGFSVISIGMMLLILGIEGKGAPGMQGAGAFGEIQFNFQVGSTGAGVFVLGAIMATLGGVLKNDYQTSTIPTFEPQANIEELRDYRNSLDAYRKCNQQQDSVEQCFTQIFFQINKARVEQ